MYLYIYIINMGIFYTDWSQEFWIGFYLPTMIKYSGTKQEKGDFWKPLMTVDNEDNVFTSINA